MSGHSKWNNIKHKKEKTDAARAKVFTKIGKEIAIAVKEGGPDPTSNSKLRDLIAKAKANNVPNDNIDRIIKKAAGDGDGASYEVIMYEGYGPCGVAIIVEATTDNRNRTAGDVRHFFDKFGGNLGQMGCVSYLFSDKGLIVIDGEDINEDELMEAALEAGAEDIVNNEGTFEIYTDPADFSVVNDALTEKGYTFLSAEQTKIPANYVDIDGDDNLKLMTRLLDALDDNDDVTNVWHNWNEPDEEEE